VKVGNIKDSMSIKNFLNLVEEQIEEEDGDGVDPEQVLEEVMEERLVLQSIQDNDEDQEQSQQPVPTLPDA
jgi:hypothetical protein